MKIIGRETEIWIRRHFEKYQNIKKAVELRKEELIKTSAQAISYDRDNIQRTNRISDPVGSRGQQLAYIRCVEVGEKDVVTHPEKWIVVVESTVGKFKDLRAEIIERRYFKRESPDVICVEMEIPKQTYYNWDEDILTYATVLCVQLGLIKVL